eukprot:7388524-Prymnesium_polylepis.1
MWRVGLGGGGRRRVREGARRADHAPEARASRAWRPPPSPRGGASRACGQHTAHGHSLCRAERSAAG